MKLIIIIMLHLILTRNNFGQQDSSDLTMHLSADSVNIREMVWQQIVAAKKKMSGQKNSVTPVTDSNGVQSEYVTEEPSNIVEEISEFLTKSNEDLARVILLAGSTFVIFGTVLFRRIRFKKKNISRKTLAKNISNIREEKIVGKENLKLKKVRKKLKSDPERFTADNSISHNAKELNISKGELLLAAKIKSYELSKLSN